MTIKDIKIDAISNFVLHLVLTIQIVLQLALTILSKDVDFFGYISQLISLRFTTKIKKLAMEHPLKFCLP
jgi:hypothetical protein